MHDNIHDMIRQEPVLATLRRDRQRAITRQSRISHFQEKAEELRAVAEDVILSETKQMLWRLADNYERMARHLTELTRQPS
ncbi:MAG: hypothetical protein JO208_00640 [Alphaproteobacteria bacterium]|nr:hypothetical protein [Alphaproteobacteria bacterium]